MPPKRSYHHGDLEHVLLETARALAVEVGIDGLSLREVSRRAGVSHTAAYNHFADKSALMRALATRAFAALTQATARAGALATNPRDRLRAIGIAYVVFAFTHQVEFRFMFRPDLARPFAGQDDALAQAGNTAYAVLVDAIGDAHRAGVVRGDIDTLTLTAWSLVHGLATLIVDGPDPTLAPNITTVRRLAANTAATLLNGMAP